MNNLATRCIAVLLSSLMIWTSVAPSYAQALDAVRQDKNLAETLSSHISDAIGQSQSKSAQLEEIKQLVSSMQAQAENKTGAKTLALEEVDLANKKQVKDAFEKTYQEFLSDKESRKELDRAVEEAYARAFYDVFDKEFKQQFFEDNKDVNKAELASKYQALRQKAFADYKEEHLIDFQNFHKAYLAASKAQMEQEFPALLNKYQRLAREEENKYLQNLFAEVWRSYYPNKSKEVLDFMSMEAMPVFKMAGLTSAEQEREMAGYLRGIIKQDGVACEGVKKLIPSKKATEQASGRCARALSAILPLGIVGQEANGSDRADAALISDLMQRSEQAIAGTEVFMAGVSALIGLKGDKELATILVYAPIPVRWRQSYEKEALNWISDGMFHPITKTVQIAAANVHDEWEYDSFAQNIENSFYDENSAKPGNIFYDLGAFLTEQSAKDAAAKSVLEKVMRTNLKYSWDTASRNQDIYPSMPFKMFMMGALSKGYRVSINVGDHFRTGKPKITDAYGVTWDAAQFKKWHEADAYRMANWACGR